MLLVCTTQENKTHMLQVCQMSSATSGTIAGPLTGHFVAIGVWSAGTPNIRSFTQMLGGTLRSITEDH